MPGKQPPPRNVPRAFLLAGFGLILLGFVGMNVRPFSKGDMRVFDWVAVAGIVTALGVLLVLGSAVAWFIRRRRV
jgi:hypothetical protein